MGNFFTSKQITIIIVAVSAVFIVMGLLTIVATATSDDNNDDAGPRQEHAGKANDYKFDIKSEGVDDKEKVEQQQQNVQINHVITFVSLQI